MYNENLDIYFNSETGEIITEIHPANSQEIKSTIELLEYEKKCKVSHILAEKIKGDLTFKIINPIDKIVLLNWVNNHYNYIKIIEGNQEYILDAYTASMAKCILSGLTNKSKNKAINMPFLIMIDMFWKLYRDYVKN